MGANSRVRSAPTGFATGVPLGAFGTLAPAPLPTRAFDVILIGDFAFMVVIHAMLVRGPANIFATPRRPAPKPDLHQRLVVCTALYGICIPASLPEPNAVPFRFGAGAEHPIGRIPRFFALYLVLVAGIDGHHSMCPGPDRVGAIG